MRYEVYVVKKIRFTHSTHGSREEFLEPHSHEWKIKIYFLTDNIKDGISIDFTYLSQELDEVVKVFNDQYLNSLPFFEDKNPTAENIAIYIFNKLKEKLPHLHISKIDVGDEEMGVTVYF